MGKKRASAVEAESQAQKELEEAVYKNLARFSITRMGAQRILSGVDRDHFARIAEAQSLGEFHKIIRGEVV